MANAGLPRVREVARSCRRVVSCCVILLLVGSAGCKESAAPGVAARDEPVVVFAAASLREVFTALAVVFERSHPRAEVVLHFAGSQELRTQVEHGAAVDVFASADAHHMQELERGGHVRNPHTFARNEPVVVVASERARTLRSFAELPSATRIAVGSEEVPIGRYTEQILARASTSLGAEFSARVRANIVSRELNVRQVLARVALGEVEAGIVYRTDALAARTPITTISIPPHVNVLAAYTIAAAVAAERPQLALQWIELLVSPAGQQALERAGFLAAGKRPSVR